jgi:hypothetical protein
MIIVVKMTLDIVRLQYMSHLGMIMTPETPCTALHIMAIPIPGGAYIDHLLLTGVV